MTKAPFDFNDCRADPRMAALLADYPADLFDDRLYRSIAWADRYVARRSEEVLAEFGLATVPGDEAAARGLCRSRGLIDAYAPILAWLGRCRAAAPADGSPPPPTPLLRAAGLAIDPGNERTAALIDAAAAAHPRVARGEASGEELLFGPASAGLWLDYFDNANPLYAVNNRVAAIAAAARLAGRPALRILEVGAGAGSGTEALLEALAEGGDGRLDRYLVTEPSAFFRRRGERRLAARSSALGFRSLDIDRPWAGQGAPPEVDLVFAVNVLHVAKDLRFSLIEARRALAPGGWLVAGECLRPFPDAPVPIEFVFCLLDAFRRPHAIAGPTAESGFLTPEGWMKALAAAGFAHAEITPDHAAIRAIFPGFGVAAVCARA